VDAQGDWQVKLGGRDLSLSAEFIGELSNHASDAAASAGLGRALLVMHAPHDQVVGSSRRMRCSARRAIPGAS